MNYFSTGILGVSFCFILMIIKLEKIQELNSFMGFFPYCLEENLSDNIASSDFE